MTLEECVNERIRLFETYRNTPYDSPEKEEAKTAWYKSYQLYKFMMKTPTQQLCSVAREIANEKE